MKTNITPLHDRVIVKRIDEGEQIRGGIIIPDSAKEKPQEGEVPGIDEKTFLEQAETAKKNCPVSQALAGTQITLNAKLVKSAGA